MTLENIEVAIFDMLSSGLITWVNVEEKYVYAWGLMAAAGIVLFSLLYETRAKWFGAVVFLTASIIQPGLYFLLPSASASLWGERYVLPGDNLGYFLLVFLFSAVIWLVIVRILAPVIDRTKHFLTKKTSLSRPERTDIREVLKLLPKSKRSYKIEPHFRKTKSIFFGIGTHNQKVYVEKEKWLASHVEIVGTTGAGKGVVAGSLLTQSILQGEAVFVIDPKDDEYLPHVLGQAAKEAGVPFYCIDLTGRTPQWNPFQNKSFYDREELLSAGLGMSDKGESADFYRVNDRKAARALAKLSSDKKIPFRAALKSFIESDSEAVKNSPKFYEDMEELLSLPVVDIDLGLDIELAIQQGAVIYVKGSMRNPRVLKLQKMFVLSLMQHCENREREAARHVCVFLDEFKYMISKPALEALGAIRDKKAHVILAHQSIGDLRDCPKDLDPESVISSVVENCALKIAYKINDPNTAEWLSNMSGKILIDEESKIFESNGVLVESKKNGRMLRQAERALIDTNMLMSLPPRCAVLFGNGLADFIFTSPVNVIKRLEYTTPTKFIKTDELTAVGISSGPQSVAEELLNVD